MDAPKTGIKSGNFIPVNPPIFYSEKSEVLYRKYISTEKYLNNNIVILNGPEWMMDASDISCMSEHN